MTPAHHSPGTSELVDPPQQPQRDNMARLLVLLAGVAGVAVAAFAGSYWFGDRLSLGYLTTQEAALREYRQNHPVCAAMIAMTAYVGVAGFSLPGATVLTLACGWYFGFWQGSIVVSFGSTGGATLAFLMTRFLLRNWVQQRLAHRLDSINAAFEREGAFYLFTLRLMPAVPFVVINAVMGLTSIRTLTFWWVSQLGMLPATLAYVYAGSTVPSLKTLADEGVGQVLSWQLLLAFAMLGLLPLALKRIIARYAPSADAADSPADSSTVVRANDERPCQDEP